MDHTLLQPDFAQRLPEHCDRWIQFVERLWAWRDRATFCFRFNGRAQEGAIGIYLLARPHDKSDRQRLQHDIEFALAAYGVVVDINDSQRCLPLLTPAEMAGFATSEDDRAALESEINEEFGGVLAAEPGDDSVFVAVSQDLMGEFWIDRGELDNLISDDRLELLRADARQMRPWIPQLWDGPIGSFLLPFKALIASETAIQLSVYLEPTTRSVPERLWLERVALIAQRNAHSESSIHDLAAQMAAQRSASASRRLLNDAFLVAAVIVAPGDSAGAAESLANTLRSLCLQKPGKAAGQEEDWRAGARVSVASASQLAEARKGHANLEFPRWADIPGMPRSIGRLPYLADARGAATIFRLPVSVRGGVPGVEVEQPAPDFNPGPRSDQKDVRRTARVFRRSKPKASIVIGKFESAGYSRVDVNDLTKHMLITGFTGSGKTMTVMHLLHQLWFQHRTPFLVIEPAKTEYRGLMSVAGFKVNDPGPGLLIYTLGNESVAPFRLNPFELIEGVRVEAHINRLKTCFEAAMPPFAPLGSIIEQSLIEVYRERGWMMTDEGLTREQLDDSKHFPNRRYPTMADFAKKVEAVGESRGYVGENRATLMAAIRGRIFPLTRGMHSSRGMMLDTQFSRPSPAQLFATPTVLELNELAQQDKALVSMFILTLLREYREQEYKKADAVSGALRHVTVLEEAHNVLENVAPGVAQEGAESDVRYKAVQAFCTMLAEIRALGEGLIISDQSPEKLAPDATRNTNTQIAHQLRDAKDRQVMANAMIMSDEQREYLGKLKPGYAAVFYTGLQHASFVKIPRFDGRGEDFGGAGVGYSPALSDAVVRIHMFGLTKPVFEPDRPFFGCRYCSHIHSCDFKWKSRELLDQDGVRDGLVAAFREAAPAEERVREEVRLLSAVDARGEPESHADALWCYLLHLAGGYQKTENELAIDNDAMRHVFVENILPQIMEARDARNHE